MSLTIGKTMNVGQDKGMYTFDFERNFFSSLEAEKSELDIYNKALNELKIFK